MKRLLCLLILPIIAMFCFVGCGEEITLENVKSIYSNMLEINNANFFSDASNPNSISIKYSDEVTKAINIDDPVNDIQKRYVALSKQQDILDCIFNFYENNQETFYKEIESSTYPASDLKSLYNKMSELKTALTDFKAEYDTFTRSTSKGVSEVMSFNLTSYSYELNKLIDESFDFIYEFIGMFTKYCVDDFDVNTPVNISIRIDKAYVDMAYIVYLENFKSFNYSVGDNGICDLSDIIGSDLKFNIIDNISEIKTLSTEVTDNLDPTDAYYERYELWLNEFVYSQNVFEQRLETYKEMYNSSDFYSINQHRMGLVPDVDYERYLNSVSESEKSNALMFEDFIGNIFANYVNKLGNIIA